MKNTVIHSIEVPQDRDEIAATLLHHVAASLAEANPKHLEQIAESLKPKVVDPEEKGFGKKDCG